MAYGQRVSRKNPSTRLRWGEVPRERYQKDPKLLLSSKTLCLAGEEARPGWGFGRASWGGSIFKGIGDLGNSKRIAVLSRCRLGCCGRQRLPVISIAKLPPFPEHRLGGGDQKPGARLPTIPTASSITRSSAQQRPRTSPARPALTSPADVNTHARRLKRASQPDNRGASVSLSQLADSYRAQHNSLTPLEY